MFKGFPDVFMLFILSWILFSPSLLGTSPVSPLSSFHHSSSPLSSSLDPHYTLLLCLSSLPHLFLLLPLSVSPQAPRSLPILSHPLSLSPSAHNSFPPSTSPPLLLLVLVSPLILSLPFSLIYYQVWGHTLCSLHVMVFTGGKEVGSCLTALSQGSFLGVLVLRFAHASFLTPYF